jgi:flavin-binding protein dodecin
LGARAWHGLHVGISMAGSGQMSVYKLIELVGTSEVSWADAAKQAIETAGRSLHDLRVAEVQKLDLKVENGKLYFRARLTLSFKYIEGE